MTADKLKTWQKHFEIESTADLDFVIGQKYGFPIGMENSSPAEFKRRVLAAKISYQMRLKSIDYTLRRYVDPDQYDDKDVTLGRSVSDYLHNATKALSDELGKLHTQGELAFGAFGAELTLFKLPDTLDIARMLANRGLLLEVLPLLRVCLEMIAWAHSAFSISDEKAVIELRAQNCISLLKKKYGSAGRLYGFLSQFTHWGHAIHGEFIHLEGDRTFILNASIRYRAISLTLCLVILDILVDVARDFYKEGANPLVEHVLGFGRPNPARKSYYYASKIAEMCDFEEIREVQSFFS